MCDGLVLYFFGGVPQQKVHHRFVVGGVLQFFAAQKPRAQEAGKVLDGCHTCKTEEIPFLLGAFIQRKPKGLFAEGGMKKPVDVFYKIVRVDVDRKSTRLNSSHVAIS